MQFNTPCSWSFRICDIRYMPQPKYVTAMRVAAASTPRISFHNVITSTHTDKYAVEKIESYNSVNYENSMVLGMGSLWPLE
jgi:hypothetical protein